MVVLCTFSDLLNSVCQHRNRHCSFIYILCTRDIKHVLQLCLNVYRQKYIIYFMNQFSALFVTNHVVTLYVLQEKKYTALYSGMYWLKNCCHTVPLSDIKAIPGTAVKKPIRKWRIFGKRATKYAQGVFYRSLSRAVMGVNRESLKQYFMWYYNKCIGKRPCCVRGAFECSSSGNILG